MTEVNTIGLDDTSDWMIRDGLSEETRMTRGANHKKFWERTFQAEETANEKVLEENGKENVPNEVRVVGRGQIGSSGASKVRVMSPLY